MLYHVFPTRVRQSSLNHVHDAHVTLCTGVTGSNDSPHFMTPGGGGGGVISA